MDQYGNTEDPIIYALNGTTITNTLSLVNGASILRVHDVKEAVECAKIVNFAQNN